MTEAEWQKSDNPEAMLKFLSSRNHRKCRLLSCAVCRIISDLVTPVGLYVLDVAERFADAEASQAEIIEARAKATGWSREFGNNVDASTAVAWTTDLQEAVYFTEDKKESLVGCLFAVRWAAMATNDVPAAWRIQGNLLRDIFGNPFRPVSLDPSWLTSTVIALTEGIYTERAFDRLPILADALQDAGCDNDDILTHCRSDGPHVRGCWPVDLILGKS